MLSPIARPPASPASIARCRHGFFQTSISGGAKATLLAIYLAAATPGVLFAQEDLAGDGEPPTSTLRIITESLTESSDQAAETTAAEPAEPAAKIAAENPPSESLAPERSEGEVREVEPPDPNAESRSQVRFAPAVVASPANEEKPADTAVPSNSFSGGSNVEATTPPSPRQQSGANAAPAPQRSATDAPSSPTATAQSHRAASSARNGAAPTTSAGPSRSIVVNNIHRKHPVRSSQPQSVVVKKPTTQPRSPEGGLLGSLLSPPQSPNKPTAASGVKPASRTHSTGNMTAAARRTSPPSAHRSASTGVNRPAPTAAASSAPTSLASLLGLSKPTATDSAPPAAASSAAPAKSIHESIAGLLRGVLPHDEATAGASAPSSARRSAPSTPLASRSATAARVSTSSTRTASVSSRDVPAQPASASPIRTVASRANDAEPNRFTVTDQPAQPPAPAASESASRDLIARAAETRIESLPHAQPQTTVESLSRVHSSRRKSNPPPASSSPDGVRTATPTMGLNR